MLFIITIPTGDCEKDKRNSNKILPKDGLSVYGTRKRNVSVVSSGNVKTRDTQKVNKNTNIKKSVR